MMTTLGRGLVRDLNDIFSSDTKPQRPLILKFSFPSFLSFFFPVSWINMANHVGKQMNIFNMVSYPSWF